MSDLIPVLLPLLLTDIINPVLLTAIIFTLGTGRPFLNSVLVLFGWFVVYCAAGVFLALGLDALIELIENPRPGDFVIEIIIGLSILLFGISLIIKKKPKPRKMQFNEVTGLGSWRAILMGATINLVGLPFALPYLAVVDQILKADLNLIPSLTVLLLYNIFYVVPFSLLLLIRVLYGEKSDAIFNKINSAIERISNVLMPVILTGIGVLLIADSILFFIRGEALF